MIPGSWLNSIDKPSENAWKLEAERLAELVEAQRQVIATLRAENERLNISIESLI